MLDEWVALCLVPVAIWVLLSGLDDLGINVLWLYNRSRRGAFEWPALDRNGAIAPKRIAIFVPLWREDKVIGRMLAHNIGQIRYSSYEFFVGVYPNDAPTMEAARAACEEFDHAHVTMCPHDGPTSKADCLNWIFQGMLAYEQRHGQRFEIIVIHDAEDLIHPESLGWINRYIDAHDMVQVPVLPLPTPLRNWTHGIYCDEFAEFQIKDMPVRQMFGGFVPSNGVGTGFSRAVVEQLSVRHSNRIFEPLCLTEDYESGYRIHALQCPQLFLTPRTWDPDLVATRELFPQSFWAAVRQRTRWTIGIALQSWERHGWRETGGQIYWFWRDRKGLIGHLLAPIANLLFAYGVATGLYSVIRGEAWRLARSSIPFWFGYPSARCPCQ